MLWVHAKSAELEFVESGHGLKRYDVMYNDFVIAGPASDPARVAGLEDVVEAPGKIASSASPYASRGDDSGTHKAELKFWQETDVNVRAESGSWYRETGSGMGATLLVGTTMGAYVMTDRATWISFNAKADHEVLVEGDPRLFNQYWIILVNPAKHPHVKATLGQNFIDWVLSHEGQKAIASYRVNGQQLFFPNADKHQR